MPIKELVAKALNSTHVFPIPIDLVVLPLCVWGCLRKNVHNFSFTLGKYINISKSNLNILLLDPCQKQTLLK